MGTLRFPLVDFKELLVYDQKNFSLISLLAIFK